MKRPFISLFPRGGAFLRILKYAVSCVVGPALYSELSVNIVVSSGESCQVLEASCLILVLDPTSRQWHM